MVGDREAPLSKECPDTRALRLVPENVARRLSVIPLRIKTGGELVIAASEPANALIFDELRVLTGKEVEILRASRAEISAAISRHYKLASAERDAMSDFQPSYTAGEDSRGVFAIADAAALTPDAPPIVRLFNVILDQAVGEGASDVHVEPMEDVTVVRLRVDGRLYECIKVSRALHPLLTTRIKIKSGMDISEKRKPQDGRALINHNGRKIDMRVSSVPSIFGEKIALRLLDQDRNSIGIEELGFDAGQRELLTAAAAMESGMFLITGPTGSGKSTTLYSLLELMNKPDINIITIEDPVEYTIRGITQIQINEKIGVTFPSVLRSVLRQDPDKLMLGEIRDAETAALAIRAALTGHAVFSTLHTNDSVSTISRLIDIGIPPFLLASSLRGIVAQRLVRKLCPYCRRKTALINEAALALSAAERGEAYESVGCTECRYTGYKGRTVIAEVMKIDSAMRGMIAHGLCADEFAALARGQGMKTMRETALDKLFSGITSAEEILSGVADD